VTDRIPCCIAGCGRTFKRHADDAADSVVMCRRHWNMADEGLRVRHKQLRKRCGWFARKWRHRQNAIERSGQRDKFHDAWDRAYLADHFAWHRVKEDVEIKAALGAEDAPRRRPKHAAPTVMEEA